MQKTVVAFGETLWDLLPSGPVLGGAPCNFACRVNSLGDRGVIVTRLGRDDLGRKAFERMIELGMETGYVQWDDRHPTGTVPVKVGPDGAPDFTILPDVAYDYIEETESLQALVERADGVCFGTLVQRAPVSRWTLDRILDAAGGAVKLLDINLRKDCHTRETIEGSLGRADILKLNDSEARYLAGLFGLPAGSLPEIAEALLGEGSLSLCLVTLGGKGALAVSSKGERVYVPGYEVEVVDTCGSGDAFTAGFFHAFLSGQSLAEACRQGNILGAMVAAQAGATAPISSAEIEAFERAPRRRISDLALGSLG
jgi:fructokinase